MAENISCNALQVLDRMLEFFADDGHWLKGGYDDRGGRRCLVGAAIYFSAMHGIYYGPVLSLVLTAFPGRQRGLPFFNDHRCGSVAELRSVIEKARAFALENAEHERAAAMLKRRLLAELERERAARRAAGDTGETYILRPDVPAKTCLAPPRLAA